MAEAKLLEVRNLKTYFFTDEGKSKAVDGVDFEVYSGETIGIVGESGCGKSVTAQSIMRLIPEPPGRILEGQILLRGMDLLTLSRRQMRAVRGNEISMIFQEPMTSLNPVVPIGKQIAEAIMIHQDVGRREAREQSIEMLRRVGIPLPRQRFSEYPHQLSGGMRQRVMIAIALCCNPQLLIADEPTTALDVTIQAQILELMNELKAQFNMAIMMITHDLGVIAETANRVVVMYAGRVVEYTDSRTLFNNPKHPYTRGLMKSIPQIGRDVERLAAIPGTVPSALSFPAGCRYHTRCLLADERCSTQEPDLEEVEDGHKVRCWHHGKLTRLQDEPRDARTT